MIDQHSKRVGFWALMLLLAVWAVWPRESLAACIKSGSRGYCSTEAEAKASVESFCGLRPNTATETFVVKAQFISGTPTSFNGAVYNGYWAARNERTLVATGAKSFISCASLPPTGFEFGWWLQTPPNPCETAALASFQEWHSSSIWPPNGATCHPYQGASCNTLTQVISTPQRNADGTYSFRALVTHTGEQCSGNDQPDVVEEEDAGDGWTCNPQTGLCTDPNGQGKLCTFNPDGSRSACVDYKPGDGSEEPPAEEEGPDDPRDQDSVSGGGSCSSAPACSGDRIACAALWQQWKTRCAVESMSGDVVAALGQVEGAVNASGTGGVNPGGGECEAGDANCNGIPDAIEQPFDEGQEGDIGDAVVEEDGSDAFASLDAGGFLAGGASCPGLPTYTLQGQSFNVNATVCTLADAFAALVLAVAYVAAAYIIAGAASGSS